MPNPPTDLTRIESLLQIMACLRDPISGCPWDIEQDFTSIAPYTIEEAYEVADAIKRGDMGALADELGDLLLQVVFHAQMASERGAFSFADVVASIGAKMIRRHPHVFGETIDGHKKSAQDVKATWEAIKARERHHGATVRASNDGGATQGAPVQQSALEGVATALPGLLRAHKLQQRAARVGFDWSRPEDVLAKVKEELVEVEALLVSNKGPTASAADIAPPSGSASALREEVGDLIFSVVNLARHLGVDAETAIHKGCDKFTSRFQHMERTLVSDDQNLEQMSLAELEEAWQQAKVAETLDSRR